MQHLPILLALFTAASTPVSATADGGAPVQDPAPQDSVVQRLLPRFRSLPPEEQDRVVARAYQAALALDHPLARAAAALESGADALPVLDADPARSYAAEVYAPALKLKTSVIPPTTSRWKRAHKRFFPRFPLPDRAGSWQWDHGRNALIRPETALSAEQRLLALLAGNWPEPGRLAALAEARFDDQPELDPVADYFGHHYRDRDGRVYAGMRLGDVWGSGQEIEVSDVEAIAYLRLIAKENRLQSPIPGRLHDRIYQRISASFEAWREHHQLRRALALRLCREGTELPLAYRGLSERVDQAWVELGHDPARAAALLAQSGDRPSFFAALSALPADQKAAPEERAGLGPWLRQAAVDVCREEGLLGLGRR